VTASLLSLPVRRPVATAMVFLAIVLLGVAGWRRIPVELLPALEGDRLFVGFVRPGSEPEVVEREILIPLEARVSELEGVRETRAEIVGSTGQMTVRFAPETPLQVRELELQQAASDLARSQPRGTVIQVGAQDLSVMARFVMVVQVTGGVDRHALRDVVDERIRPRLAAVPGVGQVMLTGGAGRELGVRIDPDRCAALGVTPEEVAAAISRAVQRVRSLGSVEGAARRALVVLEGRPEGIRSLGEIRIRPGSGVRLRHVADIDAGVGREESVFRIDGRPAVGLVVFQEEGANLVALGRRLRERIAALDAELGPVGLGLVVGFDAAETVEEQLHRLERLAVTGFGVALVVLFLFLRQVRAVAVVAVAVPVSLAAALALLYVGGWSLNLVTLFGLAVGIGMLVDNSIVVYEAVQRLLERGADPDRAAVEGVRRTVRAIVAASATNAVVFLPVAFATDDALVRGMLIEIAVAILLPLAASLLVAVGLVPLLARRLAAPAAVRRVADERCRREAYAGLVRPDRGRELFSGLLKSALRRPAGWLVGVLFAVVVTLIVAVPWVAVSTATQPPREADEVRMTVDMASNDSLESTSAAFERFESAASELEGVDSVESVFQEEGGTLTVRLVDADERPESVTAARVRAVLTDAAHGLDRVQIRPVESGGGMGAGGGDDGGGGVAGLLGDAPGEVVVSGPDAARLQRLAADIEGLLESIPEVSSAWTSGRRGPDELRVAPEAGALAARGLTPEQVLPSLAVVRREGTEMRVGWILPDGREIPLVIRREQPRVVRAVHDLESLRLATPAGVLPLGALASVRRMPPPATILHRDGRREVSVYYRLGPNAPRSGPARAAFDDRLMAAVRGLNRPEGVTIEARGTEQATAWFKKALIPVLLLLAAVLAITFESLTLPLLVMLAVPLTVLGAAWALVFAGEPAGLMALVGVVALLGLTVNPAILLVDRMQARVRDGSWTAGAAALAAVRERARPVLMTSCTTIAGLWPLAISTGREMEIWPPFATVVMGGLAASTLLTLLVVPVGYVVLERIDGALGRIGPWVVMGWVVATVAVVAPLVATDTITSLTWQVVTTVLVAAALLGGAVAAFGRRAEVVPRSEDGPPPLDVRLLTKVYGRPGPVGRALRADRDFASRVRERGGDPFDPVRARRAAVTAGILAIGAAIITASTQSGFWRLVFGVLVGVLAGRVLREVRRARGRRDELGVVEPGGLENMMAYAAPWAALGVLAWLDTLQPWLAGEHWRIAPLALLIVAAVMAVVQLGRRTARGLASGRIAERPEGGMFRRPRALWRRWSRKLLGLDLPSEEVRALVGLDLEVESGMIGILGPNGAGKTTFLRMVAGILDPTAGTMRLGGAPIATLRRHLARWVGYLPQDFGLPDGLTAREYLEFYALMYDVGSSKERTDRVNRLLDEVGLGDRADEPIGSYSGGMRQRVAVARTLLRLPALIIVDEPTVGLDPRERIRFRNLLARLAEGRVVLFSTHVVEDVAVACERVLVLADGRKVFDGAPGDLAHAAAGRVWELKVDVDDEDDLPRGLTVVDRVPEGDGRARLRVLAEAAPHPTATLLEPTLEDGYLALVGPAAGEVIP